MREQGSEYEYDPATDGTRLERVHALITACPDEFTEAIEELEDYTADRVIKYVRHATPEGRERLVEPPETLAGQFELYLDTLSCRLAGLTPNPGWGWASDVLLAYWIMCCDQAEKAERITRFQDWTWEVTAGQGVSRRQFHLGPTGSFWRRFSAAVDKALVIASARGLTPRADPEVSAPLNEHPTKTTLVPAEIALRAELAQLNDTQREILRALAGAIVKGDGLTLDEIVPKTNAGNRTTVERGIRGMEKLGLEIPNASNGAGYTLRGRSLELALELLRTDADRAPTRR